MRITNYRQAVDEMARLFNQGLNPVEIARELEKRGCYTSAAGVEIKLQQKFGYCENHAAIMNWEHKCPKC